MPDGTLAPDTAFWVYPDSSALLAGDGTIVATNRSWQQFGRQGGAGDGCGPGANYLTVCDRAADLGSAAAASASGRLRALLHDEIDVAVVDYPCQLPDELRWYRSEAVALRAGGPESDARILVRHLDITSWIGTLDRLEREALTDPLTGLSNRRGLTQDFRALTRSMTDGHVVLMLVDIDDFKAINDSFGHLVGDQCLVSVAHWLRQHTRGQDILARWGGDEFVVIGHGAGYEDLDTALRGVSTMSVRLDSRGMSIHLSWGLAWGVLGDSAETLLARADRALRTAKELRHLRRNSWRPSTGS